MLATLVIGLREGLEATLIVGIIAAFLRRGRISLVPMWGGIALAVVLSVAVGVGLEALEQALPQSEQEAMESVIGAVAVVFVTGMIIWMRTHARDLKGDLEASTAAAVGRGTAWALAGMAFLAVLKEGFETSVFLLATFQAASSAGAAALGAVIGVLVAVLIGWGIFTGGVRLDLRRFFTGTGVFLVFVAAGLVLTALRTAHEAGWVTIGQQRTVDLSWLAPTGSVQAALVTGVLGIPADPRVVEVVGWVGYLVPVLVVSLWPRSLRPSPARVPRVRVVVAAGLAVAAVALAVAVPTGREALPTSATLATGAGDPHPTTRHTATATLDGAAATLVVRAGDTVQRARFSSADHTTTTHAGVTADRWRTTTRVPSTGRPATLTIDQLTDLFGRVPVGISPTQQPGPFTAHWTSTATRTLWAVDGGLLDARRTERAVLTVSGGGLPTSRTYSFDATAWAVPATRVTAAGEAVASGASAGREALLWKAWLPIALAIAAIAQALLALRDRRRLGAATRSSRPTTTTPVADRHGATSRKTADAVR
ncbi:iron uptake transporter permease EfeU [Curtobacterium sp. MCBD17_003]|uniref:iron uptake transporter permease EfeU n=1 Tax=Curtobacterium sp. MCBD17_003 TaxID=2175667 RepID=UPI000DA796FD|nr:iron uptake transporter permease EfeU [Curtobacterium sp. MCBD17_003]WIE55279.1 FTR1 family protein [Curtobacterium sp. MCBD17_003]